jgi:ubiquinone biosynthesis protein UbiJ
MHRPGAYGLNAGLDNDNVFRIGGWSASSNRFQMDMSGNLTMAGNVTAYSDERLKKDWAHLPTDFLERLALVKHGTYTRVDSEERQAGVSAQDMQRLLAEVVTEDADGVLSVAYGNAALVACVQLAGRVRELEARLAKLEG